MIPSMLVVVSLCSGAVDGSSVGERLLWPNSPITETAVFIGQRRIASSSWGGVDQPLQLGVTLAGRTWTMPIEVVVGYQRAQGSQQTRGVVPGNVSYDTRVDTAMLIQEIDLGAQAAWTWWRFRAAIGGGGCLLYGNLTRRGGVPLHPTITSLGTAEGSAQDVSGSGAGVWTGAMAAMMFGHSALGVVLRDTVGSVDLDGERVPAGGVQLGGLVLMRW